MAQTPTETVLPFPTVHFQLCGKLISTTEKLTPGCSTEASVDILNYALIEATALASAGPAQLGDGERSNTVPRGLVVAYARRIYPGAKIFERD